MEKVEKQSYLFQPAECLQPQCSVLHEFDTSTLLRCFPAPVFFVSLSLARVSLLYVYRKLNVVNHITES